MRFYLIGLFCILLSSVSTPQIVFRSIPNYSISTQDLNYIENSNIRQKILLNGEWQVYVDKEKEKNRVSVIVPSIYEGNEDLVFEKSITLRKESVYGKVLYLNILGLGYSGEISLNNSVIFRYQGSGVPFVVPLPKDFIKADQKNVISIRIHPSVTEKYGIPLKNQFLYPKEYPGIFRDVFISVVPEAAVSRYSVSTATIRGDRAQVRAKFTLSNGGFNVVKDQGQQPDHFEVRFSVESSATSQAIASGTASIDIKKGKEKEGSLNLDVVGAQFWTPENPVNYKIRFQVLSGGNVVDDFTRPFGINSLYATKDSLYLNNHGYQLNGVTYVPVYKNYGELLSYDQMRKDLLFIKETGFNAVRFTKATPHPYLLALCQEIGLLAFVDVPLEGVPASLLTDNLFISGSKTFLSQYITAYENFSSLAGIGLGSSFIGGDERDEFFLGQLAELAHQRTTKIIYASFNAGHLSSEIAGIDLYGLEFLNKDVKEIEAIRSSIESKLGKGKIILSSVGYLATEGNSNGYTNPYSYEAQAKMYADLVELSDVQSIPGFFINAMFDYRTSYFSLIGKYNKESIIPIGISGEERETNRPGYKVLAAALHNLQKVTIPIGIKKDNSPLIFIIFGMILALLVGFLINSGRKFREDAMRALIRPYNFFADIRDLRIFSMAQSFILAVITSAILALLTSSFLYYFKDSSVLEKLLLSFSSDSLMKFVGYITWHPAASIFILTVIIFVKMLLISAIIKLFSYSVMNKVYYSGAFYITAWSFIPLLLMIPVGIVLYRVLVPNVANIYIYLFFIVYMFWILTRILKGTHVIFDIVPGKVYFFGFVFIIGLITVISIYMQSNYMTVDYILQAIREFKTGI